ncbi:MAG: hypothetical protein IKE91_02990 [Clostridia bacterium]|nr:hypothetical protein [Clostridia bacterium]
MFQNVRKIDLDELKERTNNGFYYELDDEKKEKYIELYNVYRKLFTEYIINKFNLKKYEKYFLEGTIKFPKVETPRMDFYQWYSSKELNYFYLRNNIYIEQLDAPDQEYLKRIAKKDSDIKAKDIEEFIERTLPKAIFEKVRGDELINVPYGSVTPKNFHRNDSLVIGFRYDRFAKNNLNDEQWMAQDQSKIKTIKMVLKEMNRKYENTFDIPVVVEEYNQYSI